MKWTKYENYLKTIYVYIYNLRVDESFEVLL